VPDLLIGGQDGVAVLVAIEPDREVLLKLAALCLVAKPTIKPGADQVQLRLRHRALQPQSSRSLKFPGE
jgi:hypothetical protein